MLIRPYALDDVEPLYAAVRESMSWCVYQPLAWMSQLPNSNS